MLLFILILFFAAIIGGAIFMVKKTLANLDEAAEGVAKNPDTIQCAQDYLPFDEIRDNLIDLGGYKYRKIIECTSINYHLKTDGEKEMIEASFARFLNSFSFPITIYIQTREIDMESYLNNLKESINQTVTNFPQLKNYGEIFYNEMRHLPELTGNSKQKHKYIIVGYDEAVDMDELNDDEKRDYAISEINIRIQSLIEGLSGLGIKAWELDTAGILELIYSTYHRDDYSNFEHLLTGEYTSLIVGMQTVQENGEMVTYVNKNKLADSDDISKTENALFVAKNIITNEILSRDDIKETEDEELYKAVIDRLDEIVIKLKEAVAEEGEE